MSESHLSFQSLSRSEAIDMCYKVAEKIIFAYQLGANAILQNMDNGLINLMLQTEKDLISLGFSAEDAKQMARDFRIKVVSGEQNNEYQTE